MKSIHLLPIAVVAIVWGQAVARGTLPVTSGLVLHLESSNTVGSVDGAPVTLWNDSSPSANDASQATAANQPVFADPGINAQDAVRFFDTAGNASDDFMDLATRQTFPSGLSYFAMFTTTDASSTKGYFGNAANTIIGDNNGAVRNSLGVTGGFAEFNVYDEVGATFFNHVGTTSVTNGQLHIVNATLAPSGALNARLYVDNILEASSTRSNLMTAIGMTSIGGGLLSGGRDTFDGFIGEVVVYNRVLSDSERLQVYDYLLAEFNAIPEPGTALLLVTGGLILWRQRGKRLP